MHLSEDKEKYFVSLKALWHEVFSDSFEYINLLFKDEYRGFDIFAEFENEKAVSALYLLSCKIYLDGKRYKGKYLYAAATAEAHRKQGRMGKLITQAKSFCEKEGYAFISLVPANEELYAYYEKHGFKSAMHRYELKCDRPEMIGLPEAFGGNYFGYMKDEFSYACDCATFSGELKLLCQSPYITYDSEDKVLYSPYDLSSHGACEKKKYGMIYPINSDLEKRQWTQDDIYMNLALD